MHGEKVALGVIVQLMLEAKPRSVVEEVLGFSTSVGLPVTFGEVGLAGCSDATLDRIAERATAPGETIHNEPFAVTSPMVAAALKAANSAGEKWLASQR
jgi:glycerol dehydrogenase